MKKRSLCITFGLELHVLASLALSTGAIRFRITPRVTGGNVMLRPPVATRGLPFSLFLPCFLWPLPSWYLYWIWQIAVGPQVKDSWILVYSQEMNQMGFRTDILPAFKSDNVSFSRKTCRTCHENGNPRPVKKRLSHDSKNRATIHPDPAHGALSTDGAVRRKVQLIRLGGPAREFYSVNRTCLRGLSSSPVFPVLSSRSYGLPRPGCLRLPPRLLAQ